MMAFLTETGAWLRTDGLRADVRIFALLALVVLCYMDLTQLVFALVGAATYALIQATTLSARQRPPPVGPGGKLKASPGPCGAATSAAAAHECRGTCKAVLGPHRRSGCTPAKGGAQDGCAPCKQWPEARTPSSHPIVAPTFTAVGWDAEVDELVARIAPGPRADQVVERLAEAVRRSLAPLVPEIEVLGFASGDISRGTAFGVAVPEVDIVMCVSPPVLAARLRGRTPQRGGAGAAPAPLDIQKLQKSAIRACTDRLVASGQFKFRRSAFRGQEPKVTLLAPASSGIHSEAIPIDFSVNSTAPLYNAALLTECGRMEPRARALIMLVKRWAKDRGVCHAAKGHLSPYAWTLLTIYFLQVGLPGGPLLPALEDFELSSGLVRPEGDQGKPRDAKPKWVPPVDGEAAAMSVGALFRAFARFYGGGGFDCRREAVCPRLGRRAPPGIALPLHIVLHEDGATTSVAPSIEDPFDQRRNLGACATAVSLARLWEELRRARELCERGASLGELLEPWAPPAERGAGGAEAEEEAAVAE